MVVLSTNLPVPIFTETTLLEIENKTYPAKRKVLHMSSFYYTVYVMSVTDRQTDRQSLLSGCVQ